ADRCPDDGGDDHDGLARVRTPYPELPVWSHLPGSGGCGPCDLRPDLRPSALTASSVTAMKRRQSECFRNLDDPLKIFSLLTFKSCGLVLLFYAGAVATELLFALWSLLFREW